MDLVQFQYFKFLIFQNNRCFLGRTQLIQFEVPLELL